MNKNKRKKVENRYRRMMKKKLVVSFVLLLLVACDNSSNSGESEFSISKGDRFDVVNTQTSNGDLKTIGVKDFFGDTVYYDVEKELSEEKYLLVNQETKDSVVAEIKEKKMTVFEVRENYDKGKEGEKSSSSSVKSSSSSSSSNKIISSSSFGSQSVSESSDKYLNPNISYGMLVDERDGQIYKTVQIGIQTWMAQNLNYYVDSSWSSKYNCGRLYRWVDALGYTNKELEKELCGVTDLISPQGICPEGWHIPTREDWHLLLDYAQKHGSGNISESLRAKENKAWPVESTDDFGFSVVFGGYGSWAGKLVGYGDSGYEITSLWSSESNDFSSGTYAYDLSFDPDDVGYGLTWKKARNYVRCIKNYNIDSLAKPAPDMGSIYDSVAQTLTDLRDYQIYKTTQIGDHIWMAENLNYVTEGGFADNGGRSMCHEDECTKHNRLYMWSAAMDLPLSFETIDVYGMHKGLCPRGWHIPSPQEFNELFNYVRGQGDLGAMLKDPFWGSLKPMTPYQFNAIPTGSYRNCEFHEVDKAASFWSSDNTDSTSLYMYIRDYSSEITANISSLKKHNYASIRCLRDERAKPILFDDFGTFKDTRDGQTYRTVEIGEDTWMADNMNYVNENEPLVSESWCYNDSTKNCEIYGRLYTWNAATFGGNEQGICPDTWHVSTRADWENLINYIHDDVNIGLRLKSSNLWKDLYYPFNEFGFSALPAGFRETTFSSLGLSAHFWAAESYNEKTAFYYDIEITTKVISKYVKEKSVGRSVRCVKSKS